jgi:hypothetical protein
VKLIFFIISLGVVYPTFAQTYKATTQTKWLVTHTDKKLRKETVKQFDIRGDIISDAFYYHSKKYVGTLQHEYKNGLKIKTKYERGATFFSYDTLGRLIKQEEFRNDMDTIYSTEINTYVGNSKYIAFTDCYEIAEKMPSDRYIYEYYPNNLLKKTSIKNDSHTYQTTQYIYNNKGQLALSIEKSEHSTCCGEKWITDTTKSYYMYQNGRLKKERIKVNNRKSKYYIYEYS